MDVDEHEADMDEFFDEYVAPLITIGNAKNEAAKAWNEGDTTNGLYELYANTDNMLTIDAQGKNWNNIRIYEFGGKFNEWYKKKHKGYSGDMILSTNTREIAGYASYYGYSGVIIKNVKDDGGRGTETVKPATVYIFFDPNEQIKSADTVTYDDNGNIIPLSERFNNENPDIRFSSRKEWHTGMTDSEVRMLEKRANEEKSRPSQYISDTDKWLLYNNGKNSYFAIYSVNDVNETEGILPTILYASKGNTAINDSKILKQLLSIQDGVTYGHDIGERSRTTSSILIQNWDELVGDIVFDNASVGRRSNKRNADVFIGNSRYRLSEALHNCLENILKVSTEGSARGNGTGLSFSDRDISFDSRTLLSNALATTAQNDIERKYIEEYQSKIATINEEQNRLTELRAELKELSFAPGKRDMNRINTLRDEARGYMAGATLSLNPRVALAQSASLPTAASVFSDVIGSKPSLSKFNELAKSLSVLMGIPLNNAEKIVQGMWLQIQDIKNGQFGSFEAGVERSKKQEVHRSYEAYTSGNMDKFDSIEVEQGSVTSYLKPIFLDAYKRNDTSTMATIRKSAIS